MKGLFTNFILINLIYYANTKSLIDPTVSIPNENNNTVSNFIETLIQTSLKEFNDLEHTNNASITSQFLSCNTENQTYIDPRNCNFYYICKNNTKILKQCPPRLTFNCVNNLCDTSNLCCNKTDIDNVDLTTLIPPNIYITFFYCPEENETFVDPKNCNGYFLCKSHYKELKLCEKGLNYNCLTKKCDNSGVCCKAGIEYTGNNINNSESTRLTRQNHESVKHFLDVIVYVPVKRNLNCSIDNQTFAHARNCKYYYLCQNNLKQLKKCPKDLYFNCYTKQCDSSNVCCNIFKKLNKTQALSNGLNLSNVTKKPLYYLINESKHVFNGTLEETLNNTFLEPTRQKKVHNPKIVYIPKITAEDSDDDYIPQPNEGEKNKSYNTVNVKLISRYPCFSGLRFALTDSSYLKCVNNVWLVQQCETGYVIKESDFFVECVNNDTSSDGVTTDNSTNESVFSDYDSFIIPDTLINNNDNLNVTNRVRRNVASELENSDNKTDIKNNTNLEDLIFNDYDISNYDISISKPADFVENPFNILGTNENPLIPNSDYVNSYIKGEGLNILLDLLKNTPTSDFLSVLAKLTHQTVENEENVFDIYYKLYSDNLVKLNRSRRSSEQRDGYSESDISLSSVDVSVSSDNVSIQINQNNSSDNFLYDTSDPDYAAEQYADSPRYNYSDYHDSYDNGDSYQGNSDRIFEPQKYLKSDDIANSDVTNQINQNQNQSGFNNSESDDSDQSHYDDKDDSYNDSYYNIDDQISDDGSDYQRKSDKSRRITLKNNFTPKTDSNNSILKASSDNFLKFNRSLRSSEQRDGYSESDNFLPSVAVSESSDNVSNQINQNNSGDNSYYDASDPDTTEQYADSPGYNYSDYHDSYDNDDSYQGNSDRIIEPQKIKVTKIISSDVTNQINQNENQSIDNDSESDDSDQSHYDDDDSDDENSRNYNIYVEISDNGSDYQSKSDRSRRSIVKNDFASRTAYVNSENNNSDQSDNVVKIIRSRRNSDYSDSEDNLSLPNVTTPNNNSSDHSYNDTSDYDYTTEYDTDISGQNFSDYHDIYDEFDYQRNSDVKSRKITSKSSNNIFNLNITGISDHIKSERIRRNSEQTKGFSKSGNGISRPNITASAKSDNVTTRNQSHPESENDSNYYPGQANVSAAELNSDNSEFFDELAQYQLQADNFRKSDKSDNKNISFNSTGIINSDNITNQTNQNDHSHNYESESDSTSLISESTTIINSDNVTYQIQDQVNVNGHSQDTASNSEIPSDQSNDNPVDESESDSELTTISNYDETDPDHYHDDDDYSEFKSDDSSDNESENDDSESHDIYDENSEYERIAKIGLKPSKSKKGLRSDITHSENQKSKTKKE